MTDNQKMKIAAMRSDGIGYLRIAKELGISENTVKSYCRRNKLATGCAILPIEEKPHICPSCGQPITQNEKRKEKKFCSDKCRMAWWNKNRDKVSRRNMAERECSCCGSQFAVYGKSARKYCCFGYYIKARFGGGGEQG